jgi:hypothetical protein
MPKGLQGFQKGHKSFTSEESRKKISKALKGKTPKNFESMKKLAVAKHRLMVKEKNPNWKGGKVNNGYGYLKVLQPSGKYVFEHRLVMEKHLGRKLLNSEVVHHINENKQDNRIENLELTNKSRHAKMHYHFKNKKL